MRFLLIHQYFLEDKAGGGSRWNEIARIWKRKGHEVTVLAGTVHYMGHSNFTGKFWNKSINGDGIEVIRCYVASGYNRSFAGRIWGYCSFVFSGTWGGFAYTKGGYDAIIVTSPPLFVGIISLVLSRVKRIPFVLELRDLWLESAIETGVISNKLVIEAARYLESYLYKKTKRIVVLTPAFRRWLEDGKGIAPQQIVEIPNAADFRLSDSAMEILDREKLREKYGLRGKLVVIYVGAHGVANHLEQLLDAAELLSGSKVLFWLVGDGMKKNALIAEAMRRNLQNIRFSDPVSKEEVVDCILAADIGISVLKKAEIFKTVYSNKTFDYFSCKKPVLVAIDGVSRKLVEEARAGWYVEPESPVGIVAGICMYMENPELIRIHGENGYRYAKGHFDREKLALEYLKLMEEIVEDN
jgi:glycosyltransferase involved in cell wall biosynthesis